MPLIQHFGQKDYKAHLQNYCAIQDKRGMLYIGNDGGLLEFDGRNWKLIKTKNKSGIRCLAIDTLGIIFGDANDEFGYLNYLEDYEDNFSE